MKSSGEGHKVEGLTQKHCVEAWKAQGRGTKLKRMDMSLRCQKLQYKRPSFLSALHYPSSSIDFHHWERKKKSKRERIYLSLSGPTRLLTDFCILLVVNFISQQSITRGVVNANSRLLFRWVQGLFLFLVLRRLDPSLGVLTWHIKTCIARFIENALPLFS